ncbi:VOC family protein [Nocardioides pelophilus]|uniref:VOC family protein n=1 Tax=Nocardioides pelophilus TaxID=2172019 RepID=UPI0016044C2E|nr:VOC family protein [Nocardioides pelophilus]
MKANDDHVSVRYLVDDVDEAVAFYTTHLGFTLDMSAAPAFADVRRGLLRLLLSGAASSGARATPPDLASEPGRNRIHLVVDDIEAEVARLGDAGLTFVSDLVSGPGGSQILLQDPSGNLVEIFQPAARSRLT